MREFRAWRQKRALWMSELVGLIKKILPVRARHEFKAVPLQEIFYEESINLIM